MVVRRKPKAANVEEFIQEGGAAPQVVESQTAPEGQAKEEGKVQSLKMRIPVDLLAQIDTAVASRRPAPSRHQWILEAIYEKVEREGTG